MMSMEEFKKYLDNIVEEAFMEGARWMEDECSHPDIIEAIKRTQEKILERKVKI